MPWRSARVWSCGVSAKVSERPYDAGRRGCVEREEHVLE